MRGDDQVFGQFLLDTGLVSRSQLGALQASGESLSRALVDSGVMGEDEVRRASAHALGVPFAAPLHYDIAIEALCLIPEPLSRSHNIIAFAADDSSVSVALLDLADLGALSALEAQGHFGARRLVPHLTTRETIKRALVKYQKHLKEKFGELMSGGRHLVHALVGHALYSKAGGAHVDISTHGALVRYQIGHALHEAFTLSEQAGKALAEQLKAMARLLPVARPQEGHFRIEHDNEGVRVRVSTVPTASGERLHVRFARERRGVRGHTLEALGLHGENLAALHACLARGKGLVVVSGARGAGKSTLLHTLLDVASHPGMSAAVVGEQPGVPAAVVLRATLKQHPDIVLVDDVGEAEIASLCAAAAARGMFVLAGAEDESILPQATVVVRTALVQRLATNQFAAMRALTRAEQDALEQAADFRKVYDALKAENIIDSDMAWKDVKFAHPAPSTEHPDGYQGHIGGQEVLSPGFETLNMVEDAIFKAAQGLTSVEEALRLARE